MVNDNRMNNSTLKEILALVYNQPKKEDKKKNNKKNKTGKCPFLLKFNVLVLKFNKLLKRHGSNRISGMWTRVNMTFHSRIKTMNHMVIFKLKNFPIRS